MKVLFVDGLGPWFQGSLWNIKLKSGSIIKEKFQQFLNINPTILTFFRIHPPVLKFIIFYCYREKPRMSIIERNFFERNIVKSTFTFKI
ncbi:MAG: hypothetical protein CML39_02145 [Rhodobacteraceae bacterium]|nr:MAG: hypothetical protein CML39_02145 [Paracoccaceae bacterium]